MNSKVVKDISYAKWFFRTNWYNARAISGISLTTSEISYKSTDRKKKLIQFSLRAKSI